jgi:hypothetical protein
MKFKKGQKVYYADGNLSAIYNKPDRGGIYIVTVIERTVDACGKKQMTFYDHGLDGVYPRKAYAPFEGYFESREEAYKFLEKKKEENKHPIWSYEILVGEYSDRDKKVFDDCKRIYPKS